MIAKSETVIDDLIEKIPDYSHENDTDRVDELNVVVKQIKDELKKFKIEFVSSSVLY